MVRQARTLALHDDLHLGRVGQDAPRRLARHLPAVDLVLDPLVARHQSLDRRHVGRLGRLHLAGPLGLELGVAQDRRRHDEGGVRLVHVALGELGVAPPGAVAHQLVAAGPRDPLDQHDVGASARTPSRGPASGCSRDTRPWSGPPDCAGSCSRAGRRTRRGARRRSTSPFHCTGRCAGSRNWGRASRVTRGSRRISIGSWVSGILVRPAPAGCGRSRRLRSISRRARAISSGMGAASRPTLRRVMAGSPDGRITPGARMPRGSKAP